MPPDEFIRLIGGPDFKKIGEEFLVYFKDLCGLQPQDKVLEIGCGVGRMAIPLTGYLGPSGGYVGVDIVKDFIDWNQQNITTRAPNFNFIWADIFNSFYNATGIHRGEEYVFPFPDHSFDLVFLTSVFTHMLEEGFVHYVEEISRLLKPGGRCLATFFMLNPLQEALHKQGRNEFDFTISHGRCKCYHEILELAVSYPESYVKEVFAANGLLVRDPVLYGSWSGRESYVSFQDLLVAVKAG